MGLATPEQILGVTLAEIDDPSSFHREALYQLTCAVCDRSGGFDAHHVLAKQHCRRYGAPLHSTDNALRLCSGGPARCHERHTNHQQLVALADLRDENIAFVCRWLGVGHGLQHLQRYYAGADVRVDGLLAELT